MQKRANIMGMPVTVDVVDAWAKVQDIDSTFTYFGYIDSKFSTYKKDSEISLINRGVLSKKDWSADVKKVLKLCEQTKKVTNGYFDINIGGKIDPSGVVKGLAIFEAAKQLYKKGYRNFYVEIGGDIQVFGLNGEGQKWRVGIENPFKIGEIVKVVFLTNSGIATSGTYIRGKHIYDPVHKKYAGDIAAISVIGPNVYEADRFATAAFAMGLEGIKFIEGLAGFEGYMITKDKRGIMTSGFEKYLTG